MTAVIAIIVAAATALLHGVLVKESESGEIIVGKTPYGLIQGDGDAETVRRTVLDKLHSLTVKGAFTDRDVKVVPMNIGERCVYRIDYTRYCVKRLNLLTFRFDLDYEDPRARPLNEAISKAIQLTQEQINAKTQGEKDPTG
jgi:hypothetical protein